MIYSHREIIIFSENVEKGRLSFINYQNTPAINNEYMLDIENLEETLPYTECLTNIH